MATTRTEEEGGGGQEFGEKEVVDENVREFLRPSSLQQQQQQHRYMVPPLRHGWTRVLVWTMGIPGRPRLSSCLPPIVIVIMSANAGESRAILAPLNPAAAVASTSTTEHRYYKYYYYYDYEQYYCDYYYHKPTYEDESWWE